MPAVLIRRGAFIAHRPRQSSVRNERAPDIVAALGLGRSVGWGASKALAFPTAENHNREQRPNRGVEAKRPRRAEGTPPT